MDSEICLPQSYLDNQSNHNFLVGVIFFIKELNTVPDTWYKIIKMTNVLFSIHNDRDNQKTAL